MGKHFVFRDAHRQVCGYFAGGLDKHVLRFSRVMGDGQGDLTLMILDDHGRWRRERVRCTPDEQRVEWADDRISALALCDGNTVLCASDEQAFALAAMMLSSAKDKTQEAARSAGEAEREKEEDEAPCQPPDEDESGTKEKCDRAPVVANDAFPEKRWPPPPCMCCPRYVSGKWMQEKPVDPQGIM